jgi:hypothetical protein
MTGLDAESKVRRVQIEAVVIRADGSREDLGRIADSSRWWVIGRWMARRRTNRANRRN